MRSVARPVPVDASRARQDARQERSRQREAACLDPRLAKAPADRRMRMRRCEVLPRPDPCAGAGARVWTCRAARGRAQ